MSRSLTSSSDRRNRRFGKLCLTPGWRNGLRDRLKTDWASAHVGSTPTPGTCLKRWGGPLYTARPEQAERHMQNLLPQTEVVMERLRAEIALVSDRLRDSERALEERAWSRLLSETPVADHAYLLARRQHAELERVLRNLQAQLGRRLLELV